jgi:hypothetical protein
MTKRNNHSARSSAGWLTALALACCIAGCSAPDPNTPAGQAEIAGQKCRLCIIQNPGDGSPCYAICMQKEEDMATYQQTYGRP